VTKLFAPICTILAGPNGAGKSTIVQDLAPAGEIVNADDYARRISPHDVEAASAAAGRAIIERLYVLIENRQSFNYETTLSSHQSLSLMHNARNAGFEVEMAFVVLRSADLHVARVKTRVAHGGHDIPAATIIRRYDRTLGDLPAAIKLSDRVVIYDNTAKRPALLSRISGQSIEYNALDEADTFHVRLADLIGEALDLSTDAVFRAAKHGS
jgi:predicted ABC-type ATPase